MLRSKFPAVLAASLAVSVLPALAQGAARISNEVWIDYYADTSASIPSLGPESFYQYSWYNYARESNATTPGQLQPGALDVSQTGVGNELLGMGVVTQSGYADSSFGANHARLMTTGYVPVSTSGSMPYCLTDEFGGSCISEPLQMDYYTNTYAYSHTKTRWEDVFALGGSGGSMVATYALTGSFAPEYTSGAGSMRFLWTERDLNGNELGSVRLDYDAMSDSWEKRTFSNVSGETFESGFGMLLLNESITVQRDFADGDAVYVDSYLEIFADEANGDLDLANTVTLTSLTLPGGTRFFASSGNDYGGVVDFGAGGGTICDTLACAIGGTPPIPEPQTWLLMLAGLAALGRFARKTPR